MVLPFSHSLSLCLPRSFHRSQVVGKVSQWINLDAAHEPTRKNSEMAFKQELAWATHLQVLAMYPVVLHVVHVTIPPDQVIKVW
jgi:hypothetical protein